MAAVAFCPPLLQQFPQYYGLSTFNTSLPRGHLFLSGPALPDAMLLSDFVEASFPGYASLDLHNRAMPGTFIAENVTRSTLDMLWTAAAGGISQQPLGWLVTVDFGDSIRRAWFGSVFDSPQQLPRKGSAIGVTVRLELNSYFASSLVLTRS